MEFVIVGALLIFVLVYTGKFSANKFIEDNDYLIKMLIKSYGNKPFLLAFEFLV